MNLKLQQKEKNMISMKFQVLFYLVEQKSYQDKEKWWLLLLGKSLASEKLELYLINKKKFWPHCNKNLKN